jgi:hypothetical protein
MRKINQYFTNRSSIPWLLLLLTIISFGLTIPFLGYFMDDWYLIWFKHTFGALDYPAYFALDRPLMGYFYIAANVLLFNSESPLVWNIFGLFTRWVCTLVLWQFLNTLWPKNLKQNTWVALLAAVFPGFTQHWIVVVYSFFYTCLAGLFFSFTVMIRALRRKKLFWLNYILSILIGFYAYAAAEFYFGLELIRPLIIWFVLADLIPLRRQRFWSTLKYWSPFLVIYLAFGVWRAFFFESMNHAVALTDQLSTSLWRVLLNGLGKIINAAMDSLVTAWTQILDLANYPSLGITPWLLFFLTLMVFLVLIWWLPAFARNNQNADAETPDSWSGQSFWLGTFSLIVAVLPFWAANLEVSTIYPYDRFMLAFLFGSCLIVVGMINQFTRNRSLQVAFLSILVAAAVAFQVNNSIRYKKLTTHQEQLIWQLVWRAPDITPGTTFIAHDLPNREYLSGHALATEIDWIYSKDETKENRSVSYLFIFLNSPLQDAVEAFSPDQAVANNFRTYQFNGSTNQIIAISDNNPGCLRVLDAKLTPINTVKDTYPKSMLDAVNISNLQVILDTGTQMTPPSHLFGDEPAHTWCFYFEKAELARQQTDYAKSYALIKEANKLNYYPGDLSEWYPFIDSALHLGHFDEAAELSSRIILDSYLVHNGVCNTWQNYLESVQDDEVLSEKVLDQLSRMDCD